jgi:putative FmdB family regulatory protein
MPIYEYDCNNCQEAFEKLVMSSASKIVCPKCGSENIKKKYSVFGFKTQRNGGESKFVSSTGSSCGGCAASSCTGCSTSRH